jgi:hypothetical protein
MPHTLPDIIRPRPSTCLCSTLTGQSDPRILLEVPHALGEQARSHQVQETRRDDKEDLQRRFVATFVDHVTDQCASTETAEHGEREGCSW